MCVKNSTHSKIWHDMSNSLVYDAAGPACNQAASWTSYKLGAGILDNYKLASCGNLTIFVKFFWPVLPSVEFHTYKFSHTQAGTSPKFETVCQILKSILKIWLKLKNYDIIESEKKNKARSKFDRKSQIFRPQFSTRGECPVKGLWPLLYVSELLRFYVV